MEFWFLVLVVAGLYYRNKQNKSWVAAERYEESGDWLDKRAGERGTYGSLDAEQEQSRQAITEEGRRIELARLTRDYFFAEDAAFTKLSDAQIKTYTTFARKEAGAFIEYIGGLLAQQPQDSPDQAPADHPAVAVLKKTALDFAYAQYPALLDLDIEVLKQLDVRAAGFANALIVLVEEFKNK